MPENDSRAGLRMFRRPDVRKLFFAYLVTYSGTAMAPIAMAFGVLELTSSTRDASIVIAAPTFASIAVLLVGGVLADRTSRQRLIVLAEVLAMLAQIGIAVLFLTGTATVPALTGLMLILGIALALNAPASVGLIIQLVEPHELQSVNAILGTARNAALSVGAALGGVLVTQFGAGITLAVDAVSFGISAMLVYSLSPKRQIPPEAATIVDDLRSGFHEFISHTWLWVIVLQFSLLVAVHESIFGLMGPAVTREHMDGARDWGFVAASMGVGTLVGGLLSLRLSPRYPMRFGTLCTFSFAALPLALSFPLPIALVAATAFLGGVAGQIFAVLWYTTLQHKIPSHMLSRVSAYDHLGSIALAPLGIVAAGFLYETIGYRTTLIAAVATVIIPSLAAFSVRDVRHMQHGPVPPERPQTAEH